MKLSIRNWRFFAGLARPAAGEAVRILLLGCALPSCLFSQQTFASAPQFHPTQGFESQALRDALCESESVEENPLVRPEASLTQGISLFTHSGANGSTFAEPESLPSLNQAFQDPFASSSAVTKGRIIRSMCTLAGLEGFTAKSANVGMGSESFGLAQSGGSRPSSSPGEKSQSSSMAKGSPGHIFWVVPAFKVDYLKNIKPLTPREKFKEWARAAYDPLGLAGAGIESALEHSSTDGFCGYGHGWAGYGKCFGSAELDANISGFFGDFAFPVLLHEDPRYFAMGQGSARRRVLYAVSRVVITRTDSGGTSIAYAGLAGTVLAAAASNLYYPRQDRGFALSLSRVGWDLGFTAAFNVAAEFWPGIKRTVGRTF